MIPHNRPVLGKEEEQAAVRVISSGWLAQGREVEAFEKEFCQFLGLPEGYAVAVSSGTSALFLALWALNAGGRKVAIPTYACTSLRHAVAMTNSIEVLVDSTSDSPAIDLEMLKESDGEFVIIPHMFGLPIDLSNVEGIKVIEDCAQSLGASVNGRPTGLQRDVGVYSFSATKLMTTGGQGGMVISKDKALVDAVRDYRAFDCRRDRKKRFNFQMTDLQAAIGREQLRKLPAFLERRAEIFHAYKAAGLTLLEVKNNPAGQLFPVFFRAVVKTVNPRQLIKRLSAAGVKAIVPVEDWELLGKKNLFPNALKWTSRTVSLPIYPSLTDETVQVIISGVNAS